MKAVFFRLVIVIAGLALLIDGLALVDFALHPLAGDYTFQSALYRALTVLVLMPFTVLGFNFLFGILIFFSTDLLQTPTPIPNLYLVPALLNNVEETLHSEEMALWLAARGDRDYKI